MSHITDSISVRVRFSEVDAMGVVWHGNYLKYFEDGRENLGETHGMTYMDIANHGFFIPIVNVDIKYKSPITFGQNIRIDCKLLNSRAAKLIHEYSVWNLDTNQLSCQGTTEQVFLDKNSRELVLNYPSFYEEWVKKTNWID